MKLLAEVFELIAPTRMLAMPGKDDHPELVIDVLKRAAEPPRDARIPSWPMPST
jgi:hypothetical protein